MQTKSPKQKIPKSENPQIKKNPKNKKLSNQKNPTNKSLRIVIGLNNPLIFEQNKEDVVCLLNEIISFCVSLCNVEKLGQK